MYIYIYCTYVCYPAVDRIGVFKDFSTWVRSFGQFYIQLRDDPGCLWISIYGFVWKCWVYSQWPFNRDNDHQPLGLGLAYFQTHPYIYIYYIQDMHRTWFADAYRGRLYGSWGWRAGDARWNRRWRWVFRWFQSMAELWENHRHKLGLSNESTGGERDLNKTLKCLGFTPGSSPRIMVGLNQDSIPLIPSTNHLNLSENISLTPQKDASFQGKTLVECRESDWIGENCGVSYTKFGFVIFVSGGVNSWRWNSLIYRTCCYFWMGISDHYDSLCQLCDWHMAPNVKLQSSKRWCSQGKHNDAWS